MFNLHLQFTDKINPTLLGILADHDFSYAGTKSLPRISYHVDTLRLPTLLRDGIYVDLNLSAKAITSSIIASVKYSSGIGSSSAVYLTPNPPPTFKSSIS